MNGRAHEQGIPEGWGSASFHDIVVDATSGDWGKDQPSGDMVAARVLRGTDFVRAGQGQIDTAPIRYLMRASIERRRLAPGELLVEMSGGSKDQPTGRALLVSMSFLHNELPIAFSNFVKRLRLDNNRVDSEFAAYFWSNLYRQGRTRPYEKRTTGIRNFKLTDFLDNEQILLPAVREQQAIASSLNSVQQAKAATEKVIDATRELKHSVMRHLFLYGPSPLGQAERVAVEETEVGRMPANWQIATIDNVASVSSGGTPERSKPEYWGGSIPWIKTGEIAYQIITKAEEYITELGLSQSAARIVKKDSILMAMYGQGVTRGRVAILGIDAAVNQACAVIVPSAVIDPHFLYHWLTYQYEDVRALAHGANQKNLNAGMIRQIKVPLPPIGEQRQIVEILDAVDRKLWAELKRRQALAQMFESLLNELMAGKLRVLENTYA